MKRICVVALSLVGCGSPGSNSTVTSPTSVGTEPQGSDSTESSVEDGSTVGENSTALPTSAGSSSEGSSAEGSSSGDTTTDGEAPNVHWFSDWRTALGADEAALLDGKWSDCYGDCYGGIEILSTTAEGRDFPTENFMRITCSESSAGWANLRVAPADSAVPEVQVGQGVFFRWYFRPMASEGTSLPADNMFHGTEFWANTTRPFGAIDHHGATGWFWSLYVAASPSGEFWQYGVGLEGASNGFNEIAGPLQRETIYRLEYGMTRVSETEYEIGARIHDVDGALLFDTEDFNSAALSGQPELNLVNEGPYVSDGTEWTNVQDWRLGLNGCVAPFGWGYAEYAAAAICDDWCGPFPIPGVED